MMAWLPSWLRLASTTDGLEYAVEVTHVQCSTKMSSRNVNVSTGASRVSRPKMPGMYLPPNERQIGRAHV